MHLAQSFTKQQQSHARLVNTKMLLFLIKMAWTGTNKTSSP